MHGKVLIDTSVWIDFFRGKTPDLRERIAALLKSGRAVYTGVVALELMNGAKGQKEFQTLQAAFDAMQCVTPDEATYLRAGRLGYDMARRGYTLSTVDLLIAQTAMEHNLSLMTYDEHFGAIAERSALRLVKK